MQATEYVALVVLGLPVVVKPNARLEVQLLGDRPVDVGEDGRALRIERGVGRTRQPIEKAGRRRIRARREREAVRCRASLLELHRIAADLLRECVEAEHAAHAIREVARPANFLTPLMLLRCRLRQRRDWQTQVVAVTRRRPAPIAPRRGRRHGPGPGLEVHVHGRAADIVIGPPGRIRVDQSIKRVAAHGLVIQIGDDLLELAVRRTQSRHDASKHLRIAVGALPRPVDR